VNDHDEDDSDDEESKEFILLNQFFIEGIL
jgi:hypothetical protein